MDFSTFCEKSVRRCCVFIEVEYRHTPGTIVIPFPRTRSRTLFFFMFIFLICLPPHDAQRLSPCTRAVKTLRVVIIVVAPASYLQSFLCRFHLFFCSPNPLLFSGSQLSPPLLGAVNRCPAYRGTWVAGGKSLYESVSDCGVGINTGENEKKKKQLRSFETRRLIFRLLTPAGLRHSRPPPLPPVRVRRRRGVTKSVFPSPTVLLNSFALPNEPCVCIWNIDSQLYCFVQDGP